MKFKILGAAVAVVLATAPAMAGRVAAAPDRSTKSLYCSTLEPGNPYSRVCDYMGWSWWRARGSWDSRGDDACYRNPHYSPPECDHLNHLN